MGAKLLCPHQPLIEFRPAFPCVRRTNGDGERAALSDDDVDAKTCRVERGVIHHDPSNRSLSYGDVAADAAGLPLPTDVKLKEANELKLIGTSAKRIDTPSKVNGTAVFGIDAKYRA